MPIQSDNPFDLVTIEQWRGLNQQSERGSIDDQEEFWNENFFAVGPGNMRTCWGPSAPIYTAPAGTLIWRMFFGFYGNQTPQFGAPPPGAMGWMFLSDGTIDEVDLSTGVTTGLRAAGPSWGPSTYPQLWASAKVWRPAFVGSTVGQQGGVLFGSPAGLYAWDGTTLSKPGDPAPDWLTDLAETDPTAPIPPMPVGLPGIYGMEVYSSRLWVIGKDVISFSAPSNGADFSTANGGGSFGYFGDRLVYSFVDVVASAGYLYLVGDSSVDAINNVTLIGTPGQLNQPITTDFNYFNVDPQVGSRFPRPVGRLGRYLTVFTDAGAAHILQGGESVPIGDKVTKIWNTLDTTTYLPTFAAATMFGFRVMLLNGRFTDPFGVARNLILMFHPTKGNEFWSVATQGVELTNIGSYEQDNTITPYGTDGTHLYKLFAQPDPTLIKRLSTKQLRGQASKQAALTIKNWKRVFCEVNDNDGRGVSITGTVTSGGGGIPGGVEGIDFELTRGVPFGILPSPVHGAGIWAAIDLQTNAPDATIERIHLAFEERSLFGA